MARAIKLSVVVARRGSVGSRRDHRGLASGRQRLKYASIGVERPEGRLCRRSAYRLPLWAAAGRLRPGRAPRRRSGGSRSGCPTRRPGRGSWCSVRRVSARWPGPHRLFFGAGAMLVGAHNGAVAHRIFVVGVCCEMLKHPLPATTFGPTAEPSVDLCPLTEPLRQIAPWHPGTIAVQHRLDEQPIVRLTPTEPSRPGNRFLIRSHWSSRSPNRRIGQPPNKLTAYESKKPPRRNRSRITRCRLMAECGNRDSPTLRRRPPPTETV